MLTHPLRALALAAALSLSGAADAAPKAGAKKPARKAPAKSAAKKSAPNSAEADLNLAAASVPFRRAADEALALLRAGRTDAFVARMSPQSVASYGGRDAVRAILRRDIVPFFAGYKKLGASETVRPATDQFGNRGFSFYHTLIGKGGGAEKPFVIYMMREKGRIVVANVVPNYP